MKKKILLAAAVMICLAVGASGTLAYFTSENTAHNVITSGGVNIEVVEKTQGKDCLLYTSDRRRAERRRKFRAGILLPVPGEQCRRLHGRVLRPETHGERDLLRHGGRE